MFFVGASMNINRKNDNKVLTYGMGTNGWGPLNPAQQSSLYAALVISHVYDSLIGVDNTGNFMPNLAKTWDINDDCTIYTFIIDTERQFSDGTKITAQIYKDSLLYSLKLEAAAANKSALDVLYALKGFSKFSSTGDIEGLKAETDNVLKMYFERPFRRAIDQLSGTRYGAYIIKNGKYLGTGPYEFFKAEDGYVELILNPRYAFDVPIKRVNITSDGSKELYEGKIDVALINAASASPDNKDVNIKYEQLSSLLAAHSVVILNGMPGRIFADGNLRKAAQYIIYNDFIKKFSDGALTPHLTAEIQFYPILFPGHLEDNEVQQLFEKGKDFVESLKEHSKNKPFICFYRNDQKFNHCKSLSEEGVNVVMRTCDYSEMKNIIYKTYDADIISLGVSFASADPDGIYHFLGKNGAIWSPMSSRPKVEELIEEGRIITDKKIIDSHYKKVSRTILEEVPVIHLGQRNLGLEYNADIIEPAQNIMARRKALNNTTLFQWR